MAQGGLPRGLLDKFEALPFTHSWSSGGLNTKSADDLRKGFGAVLTLLALDRSSPRGARMLRVGLRAHGKMTPLSRFGALAWPWTEGKSCPGSIWRS